MGSIWDNFEGFGKGKNTILDRFWGVWARFLVNFGRVRQEKSRESLNKAEKKLKFKDFMEFRPQIKDCREFGSKFKDFREFKAKFMDFKGFRLKIQAFQ